MLRGFEWVVRYDVYFTIYGFRFNIQSDVDVLNFIDNEKEANFHKVFSSFISYEYLGVTMRRGDTESARAANHMYVQ